ncbi:uncharacterized protein PRCAT00005070001 [Priceomyces carsonii]|uniref:uncharacterized protein n=1 Tax=Priceomyces carsonii TaxID=28549 RepID=UPI002ED8D3E2|nr:unnamed protein product [Priceomyces carsonii]
MSTNYIKDEESVIQRLVSNMAPHGTKVYLVTLGELEADASWFLEGANSQTKSQYDQGIVPSHKRVRLQMYSVLIDHPNEGLILYEVGPGKAGWKEKWGDQILDNFCAPEEGQGQSLDIALNSLGYDIKEVKHVIIGHLHIDHAGGLEFFADTETQIWVHEIELKHAFWGVATKSELGSYLPYYLYLNLNWNTFPDETLDLFPGLTLHLAGGHTPGLTILEVNLERDGTFIFTSDHAIIKENYENGGHKQGWLMRDHVAWYNSTQRIRRLQRLTNATVVFGHDLLTVKTLLEEKFYFS